MKLKHWWSTGFAVVLLTTPAAGQIESQPDLSDEDWGILYQVARATVLVEEQLEAMAREDAARETWGRAFQRATDEPGSVPAAVYFAETEKELVRASALQEAATEALVESLPAARRAVEAVFDRNESASLLLRPKWQEVHETLGAFFKALEHELVAVGALREAGSAARVQRTRTGALSATALETVRFSERWVDAAGAARRTAHRNEATAWDALLTAVVEVIVPDPESRGVALRVVRDAARNALW